ncbi:MAG: hypothetical protein DMG26_14460 [Acidobacteria bacterium]|nr:MAG: hypothetical protein DMG26_14460 [Acidobacteriota bacterium]
MPYFSERVLGAAPRTIEEITPGAWKGLVAAIEVRIRNGSFGNSFPEQCPDGRGVTGTDSRLMGDAIQGQFRHLTWPLNADERTGGFQALDLVEFCYENVACPRQYGHHSFFGHDHLAFDVDQGRTEFREDVNKVFARNGLAFNLEENGQVVRLASPVLSEALSSAVFTTGDLKLDELLETARVKFLSHEPAIRQEGLEKLWDAWERLKTIEPGKDKRESVSRILDKASSELTFRGLLEEEARALTDVGNSFMIRHTETGKTPISRSEHVDYLFHRLFAIIRLLLRSSGRGG